MLLSDGDLRRAVDAGRLWLDPYEPDLVQPSSIDVRLDRHLLVWPEQGGFIDPAVEQHMEPAEILTPGAYALMPGRMVLGATVERVTLADNLAARVEGKSSMGRLGLAVHVTAGFIDPGFTGHVTLELVNHAPRPILLYAGMRIGQLCVFHLSSPAERPYGAGRLGSRYQHQQGPTASRAWMNWQVDPTKPTPTNGVPA
jgi:dCTP deaminase